MNHKEIEAKWRKYWEENEMIAKALNIGLTTLKNKGEIQAFE